MNRRDFLISAATITVPAIAATGVMDWREMQEADKAMSRACNNESGWYYGDMREACKRRFWKVAPEQHGNKMAVHGIPVPMENLTNGDYFIVWDGFLNVCSQILRATSEPYLHNGVMTIQCVDYTENT